MLQKLRDQTQGTGFKILVGAIIVVLTLFGFGATNLFLGGDPEVARVGDYSITQGVLTIEMERERRRILGQMGPDFDESNIDPLQLSEYVTQQVVNRQIIYQTAGELGIEIPPEEVNQMLLASEAYQVDGSFSEAVYRQYLQMMGYTPVAFVREYSSALSSEKVQRAIGESIAMTDWELAEIVRVLNQTRDFAYLTLNIADYLDQIEVAQEQIATRYEEESSEYLTELAVDVSYISLSVQDLVDDSAITVEEEDIVGLYEDEKAASLRSEQRASSHILIQVTDERTEDAARDLITEVAMRLSEGDEFAALAEEFSEDAGSSGAGGRLDAVGKGIFDPAFEDALWSLVEAGSISDPVRSDFGFHIIRLDAIEQEDYPTLESQRDDLVEKVRRVQAAELFAEQARQLEDDAYEEQSSLSETAAAAGAEVRNSKGVVKSELTEGPLSHPAIVSALFSNEVLDGNNSEGIVLGEEEIIFVRVDEQYPPELRPLNDVEGEIRASIKREKALVLVDEHKAQGLAQLQAGVSVTEIAQGLGSTWIQLDRATRTPQTASMAEVPAPILAQAFALPRPAAGEKSIGLAEYGEGAALVTVTNVTQGDINATAQAEVTELRRIVEGRSGRLQLQSFLQAAEIELGVERPASVLPSS